jgi:hypothetical protein
MVVTMGWIGCCLLSGIPKVLFVTRREPGLVRGAAVSSIWPGERLWKKKWICLSRPGQVTTAM